MATDNFGRTVTAKGDTYTVAGTDATFAVTASSPTQAMNTINSMAPAGWSPPAAPNPTMISASAFLTRFTPAEQAAVWQAALANATIGVGLQTGLASGQITLTDAATIAWMGALVTAGAITAARSAAILTP